MYMIESLSVRYPDGYPSAVARVRTFEEMYEIVRHWGPLESLLVSPLNPDGTRIGQGTRVIDDTEHRRDCLLP